MYGRNDMKIRITGISIQDFQVVAQITVKNAQYFLARRTINHDKQYGMVYDDFGIGC